MLLLASCRDGYGCVINGFGQIECLVTLGWLLSWKQSGLVVVIIGYMISLSSLSVVRLTLLLWGKVK
jgi:hypothetical protein